MKLNNRNRLTILFFCAVFLIFASIAVISFAQNRVGFVTEGESLDSIQIGKSTMDDVAATYGDGYTLIKHRDYSYEMVYKNLGLSFYSCQSDPNKEIFVVNIQAPFKATTAKGIILGKSTLADVSEIFGNAKLGYEFKGIAFWADENNYAEKISKSEQEAAKSNAVPVDKKSENPSFIIDNQEVVIDDLKVSGRRASPLNQNSSLEETEESSEVESSDEKDSKAEDERAEKNKIIKRLELFEKSNIPRQCHVKFRKE